MATGADPPCVAEVPGDMDVPVKPPLNKAPSVGAGGMFSQWLTGYPGIHGWYLHSRDPSGHIEKERKRKGEKIDALGIAQAGLVMTDIVETPSLLP